MWDGLNIVGQLAGMAIIGPRKTVVDIFAADLLTQRLRFDNTTIIAPGMDLRLALNYSQEICCLLFAAELGWELDHYWNIAQRNLSFPDSASTFALEVGDTGFSGPYLQITAGF